MYFEYSMSKEMVDDLLKNRKGEEKKQNPQSFLCDYVNRHFGLRCKVTRVTYA